MGLTNINSDPSNYNFTNEKLIISDVRIIVDVYQLAVRNAT